MGTVESETCDQVLGSYPKLTTAGMEFEGFVFAIGCYGLGSKVQPEIVGMGSKTHD